MKRAGLLIALLFWGTSAWSMAIVSGVTGADMAGMEVTVTFSDDSTETATWVTTSTDASVPYGEGFAGEASGTNWTLAQQGDTIGEYDNINGIPLGVWTFTYEGNGTAQLPNILSVEINAFVAEIMFDRDLDNEHTPGSSYGRDFLADPQTIVPTSAVYSGLISSPDLWSVLTLSWENGFAPGSTLRFQADTDKVPEPPVYALLAIGLLGLGLRGRKQRAA